MNKQIGISVVVPVYNVENYLKRCVESVLQQQNYDNFELLLVDDGSTDHSPVICDEYAAADARVKVIHSSNGGVSSARNLGLKECNKELTIFLDSDDSLTLDALKTICADFSSYNDACLLQYNFNWVYPDKTKVSGIAPGETTKELFINGMLRYNGTGGVWGKVYMTDIAKQCSFLTTLKFGEDTRFVMDYLKKSTGKVYCQQQPVYNYFQIESSSLHRKDNLREYTKLDKEMIAYFSSTQMSNERLSALSHYVGSNIMTKLLKGCYDFCPEEIAFLRGNLAYCTIPFSSVNKSIMKLFAKCPACGYAVMRVVVFLRKIKHNGFHR